jgi:hypothetical protein
MRQPREHQIRFQGRDLVSEERVYVLVHQKSCGGDVCDVKWVLLPVLMLMLQIEGLRTLTWRQ